jgi:hypothetical protein
MEKYDKSYHKTCKTIKTIACLWEARQPAASLRRHGCGAAAQKAVWFCGFCEKKG